MGKAAEQDDVQQGENPGRHAHAQRSILAQESGLSHSRSIRTGMAECVHDKCMQEMMTVWRATSRSWTAHCICTRATSTYLRAPLACCICGRRTLFAGLMLPHLIGLAVLHALRRLVDGDAVVHPQIVAEPQHRPARLVICRRHHHYQRGAAAPPRQVRGADRDRLPMASLRLARAPLVSIGVISR